MLPDINIQNRAKSKRKRRALIGSSYYFKFSSVRNKHLQTYIDNLNAALENCPKLQKISLTQLILNSPKMTRDLSISVSRNAGGVFNHRFYFSGLTDKSDCEPEGKLLEAIENCFGSLEEFKQAFKKAALSVFGSGYAWLVSDGGDRKSVV